jgi:3-dehydroquinate synthase
LYALTQDIITAILKMNYNGVNMKKIKVSLKEKSYFINIASGALSKSGSIIKKLNIAKACFVVTNKNIASHYARKLNLSLKKAGFDTMFYNTVDSEKAKSHSSWYELVKRLAAFDRGRGACLIALGGGVCGDLGGFAAATYRRGIGFVQIPTTLLAQVDSAIGGKTAIDTDFAKNLIGAFYQPKTVISDIELLKTLPIRQVRNGLSEVIKYAVILDKSFFSYLEKNLENILKYDSSCLERVVSKCSLLKAGVVGADEYEKKGFRTILNFGHTIGHAIEAACSYENTINHGEAVAIGMLAAFDISVSLGITDAAGRNRLESLIIRSGLMSEISGVDPHMVIRSLLYDKKIINGIRRWVLPRCIGHVIVCNNVPADIVEKAVLKRVSRVRK